MRKNYMAHTVWRYEEELYGTHCVQFGFASLLNPTFYAIF